MTSSFAAGNGGAPSHFIAGYVGGSPNRYIASNGTAAVGLIDAGRGQKSRSVGRSGMKMTETVSDINLASHMPSGLTGDVELTQFAVTTDRSSGKRHLMVAKYNNGTITTTTTTTAPSFRPTTGVTATEPVMSSDHRSMQELPDTVI